MPPYYVVALRMPAYARFLNTFVAAQAFILVLCQTGVRTNLVHLLGWGPSRKMSLAGGVFPNAQEIANR